MIRRQSGSDFLLITQHDHALLSGQLADRFGNVTFSRPEPRLQSIRAVSMHDCGWPMHDDRPELNPEGFPSDVFETSRPVALWVWSASADRAASEDAYTGLLVSLHVLSLSVFATSDDTMGQKSFDMENPQDRFAVLKFQQHEIARQESLRQKIGLRTEKPLHHSGFPKEVMQKSEDQLMYNLRMLQAMDVVSLAVCCTTPPMQETHDVLFQPGGEKTRLKLSRDGEDIHVNPWPFDIDEIAIEIPARRVPGIVYESRDAFHAALKCAKSESIVLRLRSVAPIPS